MEAFKIADSSVKRVRRAARARSVQALAVRGVGPLARFLAAYDVSRDSARVKIAAILQEFGVRRQRSVFEVDLDADDLPDLRRRLGARLSKDDRFDPVHTDGRPDRIRLASGGGDLSGEAARFL